MLKYVQEQVGNPEDWSARALGMRHWWKLTDPVVLLFGTIGPNGTSCMGMFVNLMANLIVEWNFWQAVSPVHHSQLRENSSVRMMSGTSSPKHFGLPMRSHPEQ